MNNQLKINYMGKGIIDVKYSDKIDMIENSVNYANMLNKYKVRYGDNYEKYLLQTNYLYLLQSRYSKNILVYPLYDKFAIVLYRFIRDYGLLKKDSNILILGKNNSALETVIYYQRFKNYSYDYRKVNMVYIRERADPESFHNDKITKLKKTGVSYRIINEPLNNDIIEDNIHNKRYDLVIIDMNIYINKHIKYRSIFGFQTILACIIYGLLHLKKGGNIIIYMPEIVNKYIFDFYLYLSTYFDSMYVDTEPYTYSEPVWIAVILKGYDGNANINEMKDINKQNFLNDPTGGYNFSPDSKKIISNVVNLDNTKDIYRLYVKWLKKIYDSKMEQINNLGYAYTKQNDKEKIKILIAETNMKAINYAKYIGLEIVDWIDEPGLKDNFYNLAVRSIRHNIKPYFEEFTRCNNNVEIKPTDDIKYSGKDHISNLHVISEKIYKYIEKTDKTMFNNIKLLFNNYQKRLQKFLIDKYNVNINNNKVSRAWLKMYELYKETRYFDNLGDDNIKGFHLCEAPGNFISSTINYLSNDNKKYEWNAQSLKSGFWDDYGFMKKTEDKWDFGKDNTGDATNYDNLVYYYDKYKGIDSFVSDCGVGWSEDEDTRDILSVFQLIYALLLPRKGGNFIIKTYVTNHSIKFLAYLSLICSRYEKTYIYRASRNTWTSETYIVGISNKGITDKERKILLSLAKKYTEDNFMYPVEYIPAEFGFEYEYHVKNIIDVYADIKKIWAYLARNPKLFEKFKRDLGIAINNKNKLWLRRYMPHLKDAEKGYDNYVKHN